MALGLRSRVVIIAWPVDFCFSVLDLFLFLFLCFLFSVVTLALIRFGFRPFFFGYGFEYVTEWQHYAEAALSA